MSITPNRLPSSCTGESPCAHVRTRLRLASDQLLCVYAQVTSVASSTTAGRIVDHHRDVSICAGRGTSSCSPVRLELVTVATGLSAPAGLGKAATRTADRHLRLSPGWRRLY